MLVNDRRFFIYNFGRDAGEDEAAENGDFERDAAEDEVTENGDFASERNAAEDEAAGNENGDFGREAARDEAFGDEVDGVTINYDIHQEKIRASGRKKTSIASEGFVFTCFTTLQRWQWLSLLYVIR